MSSVQRSDHLEVLYTAISLICQTLFYGIYASLIPFSSYFLLKKKTMTKANKIMFGITIFMFLLSTAFWTASVANFIATLNIFYVSSSEQSSVWFMLFPLFNALLLVNIQYVLTDSVVVWRAWILCKDGSKAILTIPMFFLVCTSMSILATIGIRVTMAVSGRNLNHIIDISQMTNLVLSLLTNIFATSIIAYRAWQHRQSIRETLSRERDTSTKVEKILTLLVESGLIYCVSGFMVLIASVIRLPKGTLGDVYTPVHVQVAGIYPTVVLALVSQQRSLKEGAFSTAGNLTGVVSAQLGPMDFTSNPGLVPSTIFHDDGPNINIADGVVPESTSGIFNDYTKGKGTDFE
ncbi:hypothetical protein ACEPAI_7022 [Sanghuangporus weigelae]